MRATSIPFRQPAIVPCLTTSTRPIGRHFGLITPLGRIPNRGSIRSFNAVQKTKLPLLVHQKLLFSTMMMVEDKSQNAAVPDNFLSKFLLNSAQPATTLPFAETDKTVQEIITGVKAQIDIKVHEMRFREIINKWIAELPDKKEEIQKLFHLVSIRSSSFCSINLGSHQTAGVKSQFSISSGKNIFDFDFEFTGPYDKTSGSNVILSCNQNYEPIFDTQSFGNAQPRFDQKFLKELKFQLNTTLTDKEIFKFLLYAGYARGSEKYPQNTAKTAVDADIENVFEKLAAFQVLFEEDE